MIRTFYGEGIMTEQGAKNLKVYKYAGGDESLIYKYITGKLAQLLVDHVFPTSLAQPILTQTQSGRFKVIKITLVGFFIVISPHIALYFISTPIENFVLGVPSVLSIMQAVCIFVYAVLDNSDGKQARKINASSPLGLMFDHGCDMLNTGILTVTLAKMLRIGPQAYAFIVVMVTVAQFYYATLEEYFVGGLFLPIINSVNEGVFIIIGLCLFNGIIGSDVWLKESFIPGLKYNILMFYLTVLAGAPMLAMNFYKMSKKTSLLEVATKSLTFWYLCLSVVLVFVLSDRYIYELQIWILYIFIFMSSKIVNDMQIAHTANEDFSQLMPIPLLTCVILNVLTIVSLSTTPSQNFYRGYVLALATFVSIYYLLYVVTVINLLANILGIKVLRVKPQPQEERMAEIPVYTDNFRDQEVRN